MNLWEFLNGKHLWKVRFRSFRPGAWPQWLTQPPWVWTSDRAGVVALASAYSLNKKKKDVEVILLVHMVQVQYEIDLIAPREFHKRQVGNLSGLALWFILSEKRTALPSLLIPPNHHHAYTCKIHPVLYD